MTWKTGDAVSLPIYLQTTAGVAVSYANAGAFLAAGWLITWYSGSTALSSQPSYTLAPIGANGWHTAAFTLPAGVDHALVTAPAGFRGDPADYVLVTPNDDTDSLAASVAAAVGTTLPGSSMQALDFTIVEGDNFQPQSFTIPASALAFIDTTLKSIVTYADLSDIGGQPWTIVASARGAWNELPANAVDFSFSAVVTSKTNRTIAIGFASTVPAGAVVKNPDGTADSTGSQTSTPYKYDVQLQPPAASTYAGTKLTVVTGTCTIIRQQTTSP